MRLNNSLPPSLPPSLKLNPTSNVQRSGNLFINEKKLESSDEIIEHSMIAMGSLLDGFSPHVKESVQNYPSALFQHWSKGSFQEGLTVLDALHLADTVAPEKHDLHFNQQADSLSNPSIKFSNNETGESVEVNPLEPDSLKTWLNAVRPMVEQTKADPKIKGELEDYYPLEWQEKGLPESW